MAESDEIKIDIFKNKLVPKSKLLSDSEKKELLEKYNISVKQLPRILINDPVAKALNAKPGDVIEFERDKPLYGLSKHYRVVMGGM